MAPTKDVRDAVQHVTKITTAYLDAGATFEDIEFPVEFSMKGHKTGNKVPKKDDTGNVVKDTDGNDVMVPEYAWGPTTIKTKFILDGAVRTFITRSLVSPSFAVRWQERNRGGTEQEALEAAKTPTRYSEEMTGKLRTGRRPSVDKLAEQIQNLPEELLRQLEEKLGIKIA